MYVWFYLYLLKCAWLGLLHELQLEWTKYRFQDMIVLTSLIVTTILIYLTWFYLVKVKPRKGEPPGKTTRVILNRWTTYKSLVCLDIRYLGWLFAILQSFKNFARNLTLISSIFSISIHPRTFSQKFPSSSDFEERNGNGFLFPGQERETERVHEISSGTKHFSVPRSFLPMCLKKQGYMWT